MMSLSNISSPGAVWAFVLFMLIFMAFIIYVVIMKKDHAKDMSGKPLDESDLLLDHEYDGIKELDNALPPWWKNLFYVTTVFAIIYMLGFHVFQIWHLPEAEFVEELKAAGEYIDPTEASGNVAITKKVVELTPEELLAKSLKYGQKVYSMNCSACHAIDGGGGVGPNLTDDYYLHGASREQIKHTIVEGVVEKGMLSWKFTLKPEQIEQVVDYVISLKGTTPAVPKAPQGEKFVANELPVPQ
jgi:cytochrome c oxidase cbb3-type subunit III